MRRPFHPRDCWLVRQTRVAALLLGATFCFTGPLSGGEWPAYMRDAHRSGVSDETLALPLAKSWEYRSPQTPKPAWLGGSRELNRMDFDYAFQPVVSGGKVFFGSSADDTVRSLDIRTGKEQWRFTTGGPVRFAPEVSGERLFVASDDGLLYCLRAATGELLWSFHAAPAADRLIGNGRMISRWPLRSGVLVKDDIVYVTSGMWPSEGIFVYALSATTGEVIWCNDTSGHMYTVQPH